MQTFVFQGAKRILFGQGAIETLPQEIRALSGERALVVMDEALGKLGVAQQAVGALEKGGLGCVLYDKVTSEPEPVLADDGAALARKERCDIVVGIGGGSSLDVAKAVGVLVTNEGHAQDYIGLETVPGPGLPTVMVPTTAGTGSEVTFTAVFTMREKKAKGGINSRFLYPDVALLDPDLTLTLPPGITATTGTDALTHGIEAFTSLQASPMSDLVAKESISLIGAHLRQAVYQGSDSEARHNMLLGSLLAGLALASAGVGACHALAYPLGAFFDVPHGLANAVLLPFIMEFNLEKAAKKYQQVGALMSGQPQETSTKTSSETCVRIVRELTRDIGIAQRLRDLDIPESAVDDMAKMAMTVARPLANNPRKVSEDMAAEIYRRAL